MQFLKKVKSKKVISIVLVFIVAFCTIFTKPTNAETKQLDNNQNKIEIKNINNKVIGIKGRDMNMRNSEVITINGRQYNARKVNMKCTAYTSAPNEGGAYAYNGQRLKDGMIAADLKLYPIGTKIFIPKFNKVFTVTDTGSAIRNQRLDIWMNSKQKAMQFGVQNLEVYVLN